MILAVSGVGGFVRKRAISVLLTVFFTKPLFVAQKNSQVLHSSVDNFSLITPFIVGVYRFFPPETSQNYRVYEY